MACLEDFEVLGSLGKGTFGTVSTIRRKIDDKTLVWKELDYGKMSEKEKQQLVQEVNLLQKLKHPHIVRYYDRIIDKDNTTLFIIMEHCEGGDLASLIKKCRKERTFMDEEVVWRVLMQISLALAECHGSRFSDCHRDRADIILHRDIKPGNIFLDGQRNAKLGDFGLARVLGKDSLYAHTYVGTPYYMSPEQISGSPYNEKCDIWSLGCVVFEMCSLQPPFDGNNQIQLFKKIKEGKINRIPSIYSDDLQSIIEKMLTLNRSQRIIIDEILALPQLQIRLRERKLNQHYNMLKKKEEELKQKEIMLLEKEIALNEKALQLEQKEKLYEKKFSQLQLDKPSRKILADINSEQKENNKL